MIKPINTFNVASYENAVLVELQGLIRQLVEHGLSRADAYSAAYDAYQLGFNRYERLHKDLQQAR